MSDWTQDASIEKLRQIRVGHPPHTLEHRMADEEIRRRETADSKKEAERSAQIEAQRHQEAISLSREETAASHYSNRLSKWAIAIAAVALVIAALSLYLQWRPESKPKPPPPATASPQSNTVPPTSLPLANATTNNASTPAAPAPKP
jgi:anti-sigma-K factor RskA